MKPIVPTRAEGSWRLRLRIVLAVLVVAGGVSVAGDVFTYGKTGAIASPIDFTAFYCGGATLGAGADPYLVEPMRACQHAAYASSGVGMARNLVVPAPLPPYALGFFSLLAHLPFRVASALWALSIVALGGAIAWMTGRFVGSRSNWIALGTFGAVVAPSFGIGQLAPLAIAGACFAALALRERRYVAAVGGFAVAALEPHLIAPAVAAALVWQARARGPVAALIVGLGALTLACGGLARNVEYATRVLPLHAREGLQFTAQYSLTAVLSALGASDRVALTSGVISYAFTFLTGVVVGGLAARRYRDDALLVFVPCSFGVIGGSFIHAHQLAIALPLALYFALRSSGAARVALAAAAVALALPWDNFSEGVLQGLLPAWQPEWKPVVAIARAGDPHAFAEVPWQIWKRALSTRDHRTILEQFVWKMPSWIALLVTAAAALQAAFGSESADQVSSRASRSTARVSTTRS